MKSRREAIKTAFLALAATQLAWIGEIFAKQKKKAKKKFKKVIGLDNGTKNKQAIELKYYENIKNAPKALVQAKRSVANGKKPVCMNCSYYARVRGAKESGTCPPFFGQDHVQNNGFCDFWNPKF